MRVEREAEEEECGDGDEERIQASSSRRGERTRGRPLGYADPERAIEVDGARDQDWGEEDQERAEASQLVSD